jgi:hypothetical protein
VGGGGAEWGLRGACVWDCSRERRSRRAAHYFVTTALLLLYYSFPAAFLLLC